MNGTMLWQTRLLKYWTKISVPNLYTFSVYDDIHLQFRVRVAARFPWKFIGYIFIPHFGAFSCRLVNGYKALQADEEQRSNQFLDSVGGISSRFA